MIKWLGKTGVSSKIKIKDGKHNINFDTKKEIVTFCRKNMAYYNIMFCLIGVYIFLSSDNSLK